MIYLGKGGQIPYLAKDKIIKEVDNLLEECWDGVFPVDVELLCDGLGVGIIPVPRLSRSFYIDAYVSADFKTIYVDEVEFEKDSPRYRFSVAHELGHLLLHQKYYPSGVKNIDEWLKVSRQIATDNAEFQANFFAANLLVPSEDFAIALNKYYNGDFLKNVWLASDGERERIFNSIRRKFKVSNDVIARRIREVFPEIERIEK